MDQMIIDQIAACKNKPPHLQTVKIFREDNKTIAGLLWVYGEMSFEVYGEDQLGFAGTFCQSFEKPIKMSIIKMKKGIHKFEIWTWKETWEEVIKKNYIVNVYCECLKCGLKVKIRSYSAFPGAKYSLVGITIPHWKYERCKT